LKAESEVLRYSRVFEDIHAIFNVSALLAILGFVAVQRNKTLDISSYFITEPQLKPAFDTLCYQAVLLLFFSGSVILTLWNLEWLTDSTSVYIASECTIVTVLCWIVGGALLLRKG